MMRSIAARRSKTGDRQRKSALRNQASYGSLQGAEFRTLSAFFRLGIIALATGVVFAQGQPAASVKVASVTTSEPSIVSLTLLRGIEHGLDGRLGAIDVQRPVQNLRDAFAVYLTGYGVVVTTEFDLIATALNSPFAPKITEDQKIQMHRNKLERLPVVVSALKDEMRRAAVTLEGRMPDNQVIVLYARIHYWPWEDVTDLPRNEIVLRADRKSASMGDIKTVYE